MTEKDRTLFFKIHKDLPREGPGDSASTLKAFRMLAELPSAPRILDVGCGPGMQTLDLATATEGMIAAVDNHQPYLDDLERKSVQRDLTGRIQTHNRDMATLDFPDAAFDLIWAEGSIYIIGFRKGLKIWNRYLREGGYLAASEITWFKPNAPDKVRRFWNEGYPAMQDTAGNLAIIKDTGYLAVGHFTLPESSWWTHYYNPLETRLADLRRAYRHDAEALEILDTEQREIDLFRKYADYYGYVFYLMRKPTSLKK